VVTSLERLERIKPLLCCPHCHGDLQFTAVEAVCQDCKNKFPIRNGRIFFCDPIGATDTLDGFKLWLRRVLENHYRTIADIVAPDLPVLRHRELRRVFDTRKEIVLDIGSGSQRLDENIIALDITDYEGVDVICDVHALPFRAGSVDGSTSWGVLEHLDNPYKVVEGLYACTRPGGQSLHMIPFMFPFHASPADYFRFTHEGVKRLFGQWTTVAVRNPSGPVSLFLLSFVEFLSVVISFGNPKIKGMAYLGLCGVTFPLKLLDLPFRNRKSFLGMAPTLLVHVRKPL
jgi:hypothetical protein